MQSILFWLCQFFSFFLPVSILLVARRFPVSARSDNLSSPSPLTRSLQMQKGCCLFVSVSLHAVCLMYAALFVLVLHPGFTSGYINKSSRALCSVLPSTIVKKTSGWEVAACIRVVQLWALSSWQKGPVWALSPVWRHVVTVNWLHVWLRE